VPERPHRGRAVILSALGMSVAVGVVAVTALGRCDTTDVHPPAEPSLHDCQPPVAYPGKLPEKLLVDPMAQAFAMDLLSRHPTELTIAVGLDMRTARPLFVAVRRGDDPATSDLASAVQPRYPMASLAKIVTSAAALESGIDPFAFVTYLGRPHTLYKNQIRLSDRGTEVSLAKAFALSINPVFGKLGAKTLGRETIYRWADSLGFNRPKGLGNGVPSGIMEKPADTFNLAEVSSGFVRTTFLSPIHAAMIVRKFAHDGVLRPPAWTRPRFDSLCEESVIPDKPPYDGLANLFQLTVDSGTARGGFHTAWPEEAREGFELGGKTGSLDGTDPVGHYEWFAGYARVEGEPDSGIAVAVMTVNTGRHVLNASWTAASLLYWWARHDDELGRAAAAANGDLTKERAVYTEDDKDALAERPWHRPWHRKKGRKHRGSATAAHTARH
jgi:membrane peptidoglycan carboxypeptidase